MQDTVQSMTRQLNKLRAATGNSNNDDDDGDVSAGGGQMLKKASSKSGTINPRTRQACTIHLRGAAAQPGDRDGRLRRGRAPGGGGTGAGGVAGRAQCGRFCGQRQK
jgi:hypothetical protein